MVCHGNGRIEKSSITHANFKLKFPIIRIVALKFVAAASCILKFSHAGMQMYYTVEILRSPIRSNAIFQLWAYSSNQCENESRSTTQYIKPIKTLTDRPKGRKAHESDAMRRCDADIWNMCASASLCLKVSVHENCVLPMSVCRSMYV